MGKKFKKLKNTISNSFQAKIGWKRMGKRENKNLLFRFIPTRCVIENYIKIRKKLKNTIMDSFQAIIGCKRMRNRENNNYPSVSFLPNA